MKLGLEFFNGCSFLCIIGSFLCIVAGMTDNMVVALDHTHHSNTNMYNMYIFIKISSYLELYYTDLLYCNYWYWTANIYFLKPCLPCFRCYLLSVCCLFVVCLLSVCCLFVVFLSPEIKMKMWDEVRDDRASSLLRREQREPQQASSTSLVNKPQGEDLINLNPVQHQKPKTKHQKTKHQTPNTHQERHQLETEWGVLLVGCLLLPRKIREIFLIRERTGQAQETTN